MVWSPVPDILLFSLVIIYVALSLFSFVRHIVSSLVIILYVHSFELEVLDWFTLHAIRYNSVRFILLLLQLTFTFQDVANTCILHLQEVEMVDAFCVFLQ
jgi:hypothetical protein